MHAINLGVLQHFNGSCILMLTEHRVFGWGPDEIKESLFEISNRFKLWANVMKVQHSQCFLTQGMIHADAGYPFLTLHAWNGRLMLQFLSGILDKTTDFNHEVCLARMAANAMAVFFHRTEAAGRYLNDEQVAEITQAGRLFLDCYEQLATLCLSKSIMRWKFFPKLHLVCHLLQSMQEDRINYRKFHTYADEDHVGALKKLAKKVHSSALECRMLGRYLLRLQVYQPKYQRIHSK